MRNRNKILCRVQADYRNRNCKEPCTDEKGSKNEGVGQPVAVCEVGLGEKGEVNSNGTGEAKASQGSGKRGVMSHARFHY